MVRWVAKVGLVRVLISGVLHAAESPNAMSCRLSESCLNCVQKDRFVSFCFIVIFALVCFILLILLTLIVNVEFFVSSHEVSTSMRFL